MSKDHMASPIEVRAGANAPSDQQAESTPFTPGPWRTQYHFGYRTLVEADQPIARPIAATHLLPRAEADDAVNEANARLIAAAPDLYAAARCALGLITGNMDGDWSLGDAADMLRAALAKAEGHQ